MSFLSSLVKVAVPVAAAVATGGASAWATAALSAVDAFAGDKGKGGAAQGAGGAAEMIAGAVGASGPVAKIAGKAVETIAGAIEGKGSKGADAVAQKAVAPSAPTCGCASSEVDAAEDAEDMDDEGESCSAPCPAPQQNDLAHLIQSLQGFVGGGGIGGMIARDAIGHARALAEASPAGAWLKGGWGDEPVRSYA